MQYMLIRKADAMTEAGEMPPNVGELFEAMGQYMQEMADAGVLVGGDGLTPTSEGVRVEFTDSKPSVIDGPFAETKELVAGYTLIDVATLEDAIAWTKRWPAEDGDVVIEVRRLYVEDDFGDAFTPEQREHEHRMRDQIAGQQS